MTEPDDAQIDAFKAAWHQAEEGNRVRSGLRAVFAVGTGRSAPLNVPTEAEEVLRWLVSMDDPADADGKAERQTVTLTKIIERARAALEAS